jgi:DNA-binding HxlR family transcriptional regulator
MIRGKRTLKPQRSRGPNRDKCPLTAIMNVIGGKWKGLIWWRLQGGVTRYGELRRSMEAITPKMLTQQLRELEADGIVLRTVFAEVPPHVEYQLTPYGQSLAPVFETMCTWGAVHLKRTSHAAQSVRKTVSEKTNS